MMIEIEYTGKYPATCMGTLTIKEDGKIIYKKQYCCESSGNVWFDKEWNEHIESGNLTWDEDEAKKFPQDIRDAVADKLSEFSVCCGGCV